MSDEKTVLSTQEGLTAQIVGSAIADLREAVDTLTVFRRQIADPDIDAQLEVLAAAEMSGVMSVVGFTSSANMSITHRIGPGNQAHALFALAVRAMETAADWAGEGPAGTGSEWQATLYSIIAQVRPGLRENYPREWLEALDSTPSEVAGEDEWMSPPLGLSLEMMSAIVAVDRSITHYNSAIARLKQFVPPPRQAAGELDDGTQEARASGEAMKLEWGATKIAQLIFSGDRALSRAYAHIASFVDARDAWMPLTFVDRDISELPKPSVWLEAAWRVGVAQRAPAAVAVAVAHALGEAREPEWLETLSQARSIVSDEALKAAFNQSASKVHLLRASRESRRARSAVVKAPADHVVSSPSAPRAPAYTLGPDVDRSGFERAMERAARNPWAPQQFTGVS